MSSVNAQARNTLQKTCSEIIKQNKGSLTVILLSYITCETYDSTALVSAVAKNANLMASIMLLDLSWNFWNSNEGCVELANIVATAAALVKVDITGQRQEDKVEVKMTAEEVIVTRGGHQVSQVTRTNKQNIKIDQ